MVPRFKRLHIGLIALAVAITIGTVYVATRHGATEPFTSTESPSGEYQHILNSSPGIFKDVTADSGVGFVHRNGEEADHFTLLESLGGGVALLDYDGDGMLDIFVTGGGYFDGKEKKTIKGHPCKLYRNLGNWRFADVTKETGLDLSWFYSQGIAVADYDCDGWPDRVGSLHSPKRMAKMRALS